MNRHLSALAGWATRTGPRVGRFLTEARSALDKLRSTIAAVEQSRAAAETMRTTAARVAEATGAAEPMAVPDPAGAVVAGITDPYLRALFDVVVDGRLDALVRSAIPEGD